MQFSTYTTRSAERVLADLGTSEEGRKPQEALRLLRQYGYNEIAARKISQWQIFFRQFKSPLVYLLLAAALLSLSLGGVLDASMIALFVAVSAGLGFLRESRSEKTLELLKKYVVHKARVRRHGKEMIVNSRELVPGDIVLVSVGDLIPADVRFLRESSLAIDESILTGESKPVEKTAEAMEHATTETYRAKNIGFLGTTVVEGSGEGVVIATGKDTTIGGIAQLTAETVRESSFEKNIGKISKLVLCLIMGTLAVTFLLHLLVQQRGISVAETVLFFIALAVSVIPEALPMVLTFSLASGALHLAKNKVVVKRLSAVEELGSIEVLCCDKTGTLTENKMAVASVNAASPREAIFYANLGGTYPWTEKIPINAFDLALSKELPANSRKQFAGYQKIDEIPFSPSRRYNGVLVKKGSDLELIVRGAPEEILSLAENLNDGKLNSLQEWTAYQGRKGRRVLAIAKKRVGTNEAYHLEKGTRNLSFLGLISFADPIKSTAKNTIRKARKLGVGIKILTGDSREVAGAVAYEVGIVDSPEAAMTGVEFDALSHAEQSTAVEKYAVFARVSPEQKYKIIKLLQENYEVGFLGEGINDAPALKIANVAIVVQGAADVAQEAADVILLRKGLKAVVDGIGEGRKIFANTVKYIKTTLASNFGNFYAIACASLLIPFLPMRPLQILLLNLLSDFPMIAIITDNVDSKELKRPRGYDAREIALFSIIMGTVSAIFDFTCFGLFYRASPQILQTNWFLESVLTELALIISARTKRLFFLGKKPSATLLGLTALATMGTILLPFTNIGKNVFNFIQPAASHLAIVASVVIAYFLASEGTKLLYYRIMNRSGEK